MRGVVTDERELNLLIVSDLGVVGCAKSTKHRLTSSVILQKYDHVLRFQN